MVRKLAGYGAALIALYIVVANASNSGTVFTSGAAGGVSLVKTLQGR